MSYVLFIDSGLGGATIIKSFLKKYGNINFIFHCENAHAPLGNLSKEKLQNLCYKIVDNYVKKYDIVLIVLACNTLTSACVKDLRKRTKLNIIGVEPNVKVDSGETLVLATKYTIQNSAILRGKNFNMLALPKLSFYIDKYYPEQISIIYKYLKKELPLNQNFQNIILGCTHYVLVQNQLTHFYPKANFYNSVLGTINQIYRLICSCDVWGSEAIIVLSKKDKNLLKKIKKYIFS